MNCSIQNDQNMNQSFSKNRRERKSRITYLVISYYSQIKNSNFSFSRADSSNKQKIKNWYSAESINLLIYH